MDDPTTRKFECVAGATSNRCEIVMSYVLQRSICSKACVSDDDCGRADPDSACQTGFHCARITETGPMCCKKLCACGDGLGITTNIDQACLDGTSPCCQDSPESCG